LRRLGYNAFLAVAGQNIEAGLVGCKGALPEQQFYSM